MEIPFTSMALLGINFDSLATLTATGQTHIRCLCIFVPHLRTCRAGKTGVRLQFHKGLRAARELFKAFARLSVAKKLTSLVEVMGQKASKKNPMWLYISLRGGTDLSSWRDSDWMILWNSCTAPKTSSLWKITNCYCHQATTNASPGRRAQAPRPTWMEVKGSKSFKALR